jgi:hypothetical protein
LPSVNPTTLGKENAKKKPKIFAECLMVGTRQRVTAVTYVRLCRVPGFGKDFFAECFSLLSARYLTLTKQIALGKDAVSSSGTT